MLRDAWAGEPFVVVTDGLAVDQGHRWAPTAVHVTALGRPPHRLGRRPRRPRQPGQGGVGPGRPVRQPRARACPRPPACRSWGSTREHRRRPRGSSPAAWPAGSRRRATPTWRSSPPPTAGRSPPPACSRRTWWWPRRSSSAAATWPPPAGGPRPSCSTAATPTPPPAAEGEADAERMCSLTAEAIGAAPDEVLVCSTGLIGYPLPMDAPRGRHPRGRGGPGRRAGARHRRRRGDHDHRHPAQGDRRAGRRLRRRRAWPRAPPCWRPTWPRCWPCSPPTPRSSPTLLAVAAAGGRGRQLQRHDRRRLHVDQRHRALLASGRAGAGRPRRRSRRPSPTVCLDLATQMVGDAEGAHQGGQVRVTGAASDDEARQAARKVAESQLVKCSWFGDDPYWGRVASDLGTRRRRARPGDADDRLRRHGRQPGLRRRRPRRRRRRRAHGGRVPRAHCDLGVGDGEARVLTNDLTYGYIDENMGTS